MNAEEFGQLKQKILRLVPRESITINLPKKLIIRAPNRTFIKFGHMEMPAELLETSPQMTIDMLHNKLIIQWTDDVDAPTYENIGEEILGKRPWGDPRAEKAVEWINRLVSLDQFFGG